MKKLNNIMYFIFDYTKPDFIDSAIGVDELATIFNKSRTNMLRSLNNYKKHQNYLTLGDKKVIIIDELELRGGAA